MTATLAWVPRFVFGTTDLTLTYPLTRWDPGARTVGRVLHSVTGVLGPTLNLRKYLLSFHLRYLESEWPDVSAFISYVQMGAPFTWYLNALDGGDQVASVECYLESPRVSELIRPTRDTAFLSLFTLPMTISRQSEPWDLEYFRIPPE